MLYQQYIAHIVFQAHIRLKNIYSIDEQLHGDSSYFGFRYDKSSETSLEHIWNNANHLVITKYKLSKTEPRNLNYVFADEAILRRFSDHYYLVVPAIMRYAIDLICDMFEEFVHLNKYTIMINKFNRILHALEILEKESFEQVGNIYRDFDRLLLSFDLL